MKFYLFEYGIYFCIVERSPERQRGKEIQTGKVRESERSRGGGETGGKREVKERVKDESVCVP